MSWVRRCLKPSRSARIRPHAGGQPAAGTRGGRDYSRFRTPRSDRRTGQRHRNEDRHLLAASAGKIEYRPIDIRGGSRSLREALGKRRTFSSNPSRPRISMASGSRWLAGSRASGAAAVPRKHDREFHPHGSRTVSAPDSRHDAARRSPAAGRGSRQARCKTAQRIRRPRGGDSGVQPEYLARINRELDGRFDLATFAHEARYTSA